MAWFRRRPSTPPAPSTDGGPDCLADPTPDVELVPVASATALARTERALSLLASRYIDLADTVADLERRVEAQATSAADVDGVRRDSDKVAAELRRLEVNLAARLEAVRAELDAVAGRTPAEVDLRVLTPSDTGWQPARSA